MKTIKIHSIDISTSLPLQYADEGIRAGFPSPAQDYMEQAIDLKETNRTNRHIYFMKELYQDYFRLTLHDLQQ